MSAVPDRLSGGAAAGRQEAAERPWWRRTLDALWQVVVATVGSCMRHRVTGLAAEAAFFAVLSVPPLIFAMAGAIGYVSDQFTAAQIDDVRQAVLDLASRALTDRAVDKIITPTIDDVLGGGRLDVISVGFVLALWSGSRAMHVFVDTITIMHGLGGHRGIIKTRALSFGLYLLAMLTGVVSIPLIVAGPSLVRAWLPDQLDFLMAFYWPAVLALSICFLATLYHVSVPVRTNWTFNLPGATFSLACWILGSFAAALVPHRDRGGLAVDLRAARRPDRRAAVAVPRRDRRADRRGGQRVVRLRLPPEGDHVRPPRAGPAAAPADGPRGGRGSRRVGGASRGPRG